MDTLIHLTIPELLLIILGCLIAGFTIAFLWDNRKDGETMLKTALKKYETETDQWRLKYYDVTESKEKIIADLSETIKILEEKEESQAVEIEELTLLNQQLMLKNKSVSPQNTDRTSEIETLKQNISELEVSLTELKQQMIRTI